MDPILASALAHWLASLKTWSIRVLGKVLNRFLQLDRSGSKARLATEFLINKSTKDKASSLTIRFFIHREEARAMHIKGETSGTKQDAIMKN